MDKITVGQKIYLPAIPAGVRPVKDGDFIVVLENGHNIKIMYDIFHINAYKKTLPPMLFFSFWSSREGMTFAIIIDKNFTNDQAAKEAINKLPASIAKKARIISRWDEKSVFFNRQVIKN
jgi:hypothetical protein